MSGRFVYTLLLLLIEGSIASPHALAAGPVHGAKAAGTGTAFAAIADDPSAIASNPAGIGFQKGTRLYQGLTAVTIGTRYSDDAGHSESTDYQMFYVPHLYLSSHLEKSELTLGLGIFSPFGIGGRKWPSDGPTRYFSTESLIATAEANPTIAWRPFRSFSIAAGLVYLWSSSEMHRMVDQAPFGADGTMEFKGTGDGWGWNAGLLWEAPGNLRLGAAFRSPIEVGVNGKFKMGNIAPALQPLFGGSHYETDASMDVKFPPIATVGLAWLPLRPLILTVEVEWVGWSTFGTQTIHLEGGPPPPGLGDMPLKLEWKDSWIYKFGLQYGICENLDLRLGYCFLESPVPESTLTPASPESPQHDITIGIGYRWGKTTIDIFYMIALYETIKVDNGLLDGSYSNQGHYFGMSLGWRF